jgi:hypothetical protein
MTKAPELAPALERPARFHWFATHDFEQGGQHMSARSPGRAALRDTVFPIGGIGGADRMGFWLERCRDIPGE